MEAAVGMAGGGREKLPVGGGVSSEWAAVHCGEAPFPGVRLPVGLRLKLCWRGESRAPRGALRRERGGKSESVRRAERERRKGEQGGGERFRGRGGYSVCVWP